MAATLSRIKIGKRRMRQRTLALQQLRRQDTSGSLADLAGAQKLPAATPSPAAAAAAAAKLAAIRLRPEDMQLSVARRARKLELLKVVHDGSSASSSQMPLSPVRLRRPRMLELPRLRNKFHDQSHVLGSVKLDHVGTNKRHLCMLAQRLGLNDEDWNAHDVYHLDETNLKKATMIKLVKERMRAAECIQRHWQGFRVYAVTQRTMQARRVAATRIQRWWVHVRRFRAPVQRRLRRKPVELRASIKIQAAWRGCQARQETQNKRSLRSIGLQMNQLRTELTSETTERLQATFRAYATHARERKQQRVAQQLQEERQRAAKAEEEARLAKLAAEAEAEAERQRLLADGDGEGRDSITSPPGGADLDERLSQVTPPVGARPYRDFVRKIRAPSQGVRARRMSCSTSRMGGLRPSVTPPQKPSMDRDGSK